MQRERERAAAHLKANTVVLDLMPLAIYGLKDTEQLKHFSKIDLHWLDNALHTFMCEGYRIACVGSVMQKWA